MKKILSIVIALLMVFSLAVSAVAAESAVGTTLRLEKAQGSVTVKNASGKDLKIKSGMRLYSGSKTKTDKESYAYISLDSGKAVKLGASSEGEVRKSGKKLELKVLSGELFFDVSVPLENDESLNIRTSTMVTGVRGTVGYVVVHDRYRSEICLLEGKLTVTSTDERSGEITTREITAGQKATTVMQQTAQGEQVKLTVEPLKEREVPGFVAVEVAENPVLQERIEKKSPLQVPEIIRDAKERLETEQKEAAETAKEIQRQIEEQQKETEQSEPVQIFEPKSETGGSSYSPPAEVRLSEKPNAAELQNALSGGSPVVTVPARATLYLESSTAIPNNKTLKVEDGATVNVPSGSALTVESGGTLNVETGAAVEVQSGATLTVDGTVNVKKDSFLNNAGTISITSMNSIHVGGTLNNSGEIHIGNNMGESDDGSESAKGLLEIMDGGFLNNGTENSDDYAYIRVYDGSKLDNYGTINHYGTITAVETAVTNYNTMHVNSGEVYSESGTAIINSGMATISGTVTGRSCAISNTKTDPEALVISENAEVKATGDTSETCVIKGPFTWTGGCLMAKDKSYFPQNIALPVLTEEGQYLVANYTATEWDLPANATTAQLKAALGIASAVNVKGNLELSESVTIPEKKTLNIQSGTLTVSGGTVTVQAGALIQNIGGTVKVEAGEMSGEGTSNYFIHNEGGTAQLIVSGGEVKAPNGGAIYNMGLATVTVSGSGKVSAKNTAIDNVSGTVEISGTAVVESTEGIAISNGDTTTISGGTVSGGSYAIKNDQNSEVTVSGGAVESTNTAILNSNGTVIVSGGTVSADDTAISNSGTVTVSGGKVSGGKKGIDHNGGNLTIKKDAIVQVTASSGDTSGTVYVINKNADFQWEDGLLRAQDANYFPAMADLAEITSAYDETEKRFYKIADYMNKKRNLTADRIAKLNDILRLSHVTSVTLDLGGSSASVELGQALTVPENKTLTLEKGTLAIGKEDSIAVNGSLVYDNIVNSGSVTVNSGGSVTGAGDFTNNGTVINNNSFISGTNFTNNASLTNNSGNSDNSNHVRFTNGGTFTNNGSVQNNGCFDSPADTKIYNGQTLDSKATFTNNGDSELINRGTFYQYSSGEITFNGDFYNYGEFIDCRIDKLRALTQNASTYAVSSLAEINSDRGLVMTVGTVVKLFGTNQSPYSIPVSIAVPESGSGSVTLDMNGLSIDIIKSSLPSWLEVPSGANLTVTSSSKSTTKSCISSRNAEATIKVQAGGRLSYDENTVIVKGNIIDENPPVVTSFTAAQAALKEGTSNTVVLDLTEETTLQTIAELVIPANKTLKILGGSVSLKVGENLQINGIIKFLNSTLTEHTTISGNGDSLKIESTTTVETPTSGSTVTINENGVTVTSNSDAQGTT